MEKGLHTLDIVIILGFLIICLALGLYKIPKIKNIKDYAIGGKYISIQMLTATLLATEIGAGATVGTIEKVYSMGLLFALVTLLSPLGWLTSCYVYSRGIQRFKEAGCISISDIMGNLYGDTGRWITSILAQFCSIVVIAMQTLAIGYLLSYYLNITQVQGALIGFSVLVLYSAFGGIRAVIVTDAFQAAILYIGIPAACFAAYYDIGGYDGIMSSLPQQHTTFEYSAHNIWLFLTLFLWSILPGGAGPLVQRYLMANDNRQVWQVGKLLFFLNIPILIVTILIGYIIKVKIPDMNPNMVFYYLIDNYLPVGIKGLVIIGILAAIMSTADSWLNTAAIVWSHDIIKRLLPRISDFYEVLIARICTVVIGALSAALIFIKPSSIMAMDWLACSLWQPVMSVPLIAGLFGYRAKVKSYSISVCLALLASIITAYFQGMGTDEVLNFTTFSIGTGMVFSAIGLFGTDYILKKQLPF